VSTAPEITLHGLPPSHPSRAAEIAIRAKGLEFERVEMDMGGHNEQMEAIYGAGNRTVPGMLVDGEPIHGSRAIFAKLEEIAPDPPLYPDPIAAAVHEADRWGDEELQDLGRSLPWGALHFRPEAFGTFAGGETLGPRLDEQPEHLQPRRVGERRERADGVLRFHHSKLPEVSKPAQ